MHRERGRAPEEQPQFDPDQWAIDGERLRALRQELGLSQQDLALRSGVRQQHISNMERRHTKARLGTVMHLATALGAPLTELLPGSMREAAPLVLGRPMFLPDGDHQLADDMAALNERLDACLVQAEQLQQLLEQVVAVQRSLTQSLAQFDRAIRRRAPPTSLLVDGPAGAAPADAHAPRSS